MSMRDSLTSDIDGLGAGRLRLPASFVLPLLPILVYGWLSGGSATIESWQEEVGETGMVSAVGGLVQVQLLPSVWVLLLLVAIAVAGHVAARQRSEAAEAVRARVASIVTMWVVAGVALFGGWAWIAYASLHGTDVGIPFPLMGTMAPLVG